MDFARKAKKAAAAAAIVGFAALGCISLRRGTPGPSPFTADLRDTLKPPWVRPTRVIAMDTRFAGQWLVAGDLDGDGRVDFLSARNDRQAITAMSAYGPDGRVLWRWGKAGAGKAAINYDVPAQIYDTDGDGRNEVVYSIEGYLVVAEGATGREIRRFALPEGLRVADCIVFADLTGGGRARDVIIKDRYHHIWAFDRNMRLLWKVHDPGGYRTCHHPELIDIDGDGRDEVMAGYTLLDDDGRELWTLKSEKTDLARGHLDCCRVVRSGKRPEDFRLVLTCCSANDVVLVDGKGRTIWEITGHHFESADVGEVRPDVPGREIVVDVDHRPYGESPTWIISEDGRRLGIVMTNYSRHHDLVDWNGDGVDEIVLGHARSICDGHGRRVATLAPAGLEGLNRRAEGDPEPFVFVGDVTGDGREDVVLHTAERIEIYANPAVGTPPKRRVRIGSGANYTFY